MIANETRMETVLAQVVGSTPTQSISYYEETTTLNLLVVGGCWTKASNSATKFRIL